MGVGEEAMIFDISEVLGGCFVLVALAAYVRWLFLGPSARARELIRQALDAKHMKLLSVTPKPEFRIGQGSKSLLVARAVDVFGHERTQYFEVHCWADIFTRNPRVRELGSSLGTMRFLSSDEL
jgi:hypothetical protein